MKDGTQAYIEKSSPAQFCRAAFSGCTGRVEFSFHCIVEGHHYQLCGVCSDVWRSRVAAEPALRSRCPGCENTWRASYSASGALQASFSPPGPLLTGPAADAIRQAMHMEGILADQQAKVLRRLRSEFPRLAEGTVYFVSIEQEVRPQEVRPPVFLDGHDMALPEAIEAEDDYVRNRRKWQELGSAARNLARARGSHVCD